MSRTRSLFGLAAALALGLAACGGDTTSSGDPLTEAEAAELAEAIAEGGFAGFGGYSAAPMRAPSEPAVTVTIALNDTYSCDDAGGTGTVTVAGSITADVNEQTGAGTFGFNYTLTPHGCQVTTSGGKVFTLDGDPNLKVTGDFTWSETAAEGTLNYDGGFAWEASDGRSGTCGVDLAVNYDFNFSSTGSSGSATVSGSVCGVTVNRTVSVEA